MKLTKIMVVSGFLGSGKTTSMLALSNHFSLNNRKAYIIVNDLGANLVDTKYSLKMNPSVTEISSGCICYQMENMIDKLNRIINTEHPELIMSDIPGCGVGALDHVYHKLFNEYKDQFSLAPFTVIVDPERLQILMDSKNAEKMNIKTELSYLMIKQLEEADLIILNKIDLLTDSEIKENIEYLNQICPGTKVIPISAKYNKNIELFSDFITNNRSKLKKVTLDIQKFTEAENLLSWYNRRISLISNKEIEINNYIKELMENIKNKLIDINGNTLHLKVFAYNIQENIDDYAKASLIGVDHEIEFDKQMEKTTKHISIIINMRSIIQSEELACLVNDCIDQLTDKYDIKTSTQFMESFGIMDPK